jgi:hypothetical protein
VTNQVVDMGLLTQTATPARDVLGVETIDVVAVLRGLKIVETNHVWAADVTYIPMACGFLYLVAIIHWASRAVLAWRLSNTKRCEFLRGGAGGGAASVRKAADFQYRAAARAVDMPLRLNNANALPTHLKQRQKQHDSGRTTAGEITP